MWSKRVAAGSPKKHDAPSDLEEVRSIVRSWRQQQEEANLPPPKAQEKWDAIVDFVVVGGGSSGCAVATRIAEGLPQMKTLLLEAGKHNDIPQIQTAVDYFGKVEEVFGSERDWLYNSEPQSELNGRGFYWPRGKVLGGCSSFNTMVWMRGDPHDFDVRWRDALGPGGADLWGYNEMLACYKRAETHPFATEHTAAQGAWLHGDSGPITVAPLGHASHSPDNASHPVTRSFVDAALRLGYPRNDDFGRCTEGAGLNEVNARGGRRCSAAAYLKRLGAYPDSTAGDTICSPDGSLQLWLSTHALRVLFDPESSPPRAVGVEVDREDGTRLRVRARREVVLSCGAVNSPQLLMLSGVGPADHLREVFSRGDNQDKDYDDDDRSTAKGSDHVVIHDLPGVGRHLRDHLHVPMCYRVKGGVRPHSHSNICEGSLFLRLHPESPAPDLQVHCGVLFFDPTVFSPEGEGFTLTPSLIHPRSAGRLTLRSADPYERPLIEAAYLTDEGGEDLQVLVDGVKVVRKLGRAMLDTAVSGLEGEEIYPGPAVQTDAEIEDYVRNHVGTMYHPACTCRMGPDDDPLAVLDLKLRVRGLSGLRVVDASAMPEIVGANTNATCVAMGERAAAFIVADWTPEPSTQ